MRFRFPDNSVHKVIQSGQNAAVLTSSNVAEVEYDRNYTTGDISQFTSFSAIFDQYMISEIEAWLVPRNPTGSSGSATINRGLLYSVVDYDDSSALSTNAAFQQYENCVMGPSVNGHYRRFKPHVATGAYAGTFTGFANTSDQWIDCGSTTVQHYGTKWLVSASDVAGDEVVYDHLYRIHISFRNLR
jgi:hypothetical protein